MEKIFSKFILLTLSLWILSVCFIITALAQNVYTNDCLEYTVENHSITVLSYFGQESEVTIPAMIAGDPVNKIGKGAFAGTSVKKVYLPDTIEEIEEGALDAGIAVVYNSNTDQPMESVANEIGEKAKTQMKDKPENTVQTEAGISVAGRSKNENAARSIVKKDTTIKKGINQNFNQKTAASSTGSIIPSVSIIIGVIAIISIFLIMIRKK